jgi:hypothetical protein
MEDARNTILTVAIVFAICKMIDFNHPTFLDMTLLIFFATYVIVEMIGFAKKS